VASWLVQVVNEESRVGAGISRKTGESRVWQVGWDERMKKSCRPVEGGGGTRRAE
jgi:hypothetical protein